jgi:hypothetical protein
MALQFHKLHQIESVFSEVFLPGALAMSLYQKAKFGFWALELQESQYLANAYANTDTYWHMDPERKGLFVPSGKGVADHGDQPGPRRGDG